MSGVWRVTSRLAGFIVAAGIAMPALAQKVTLDVLYAQPVVCALP